MRVFETLKLADKVVTFARTAISLLQPDDPLVFKRRADVLGKLGRRQQAVDDYRRAVDIESAKRKIYVTSKAKAGQQVAKTWETV